MKRVYFWWLKPHAEIQSHIYFEWNANGYAQYSVWLCKHAHARIASLLRCYLVIVPICQWYTQSKNVRTQIAFIPLHRRLHSNDIGHDHRWNDGTLYLWKSPRSYRWYVCINTARAYERMEATGRETEKGESEYFIWLLTCSWHTTIRVLCARHVQCMSSHFRFRPQTSEQT